MKTRSTVGVAPAAMLCALLGGVAIPRVILAHGQEGAYSDHTELAPVEPLNGYSVYQLASEWRDDRDLPVPIGQLHGKPVMLLMFYTSCDYVCPVLVEDVKAIEATLRSDERDGVTFALVSFDPARDTPAALHAYREKRNLDPVR